jgi:hypothetical protein
VLWPVQLLLVAFLLLSGGPRVVVVWPAWCVPLPRWSWFGAVPRLKSTPLSSSRVSFSHVRWFDAFEPRREGRGPLRHENLRVFGACSPGCLPQAQSPASWQCFVVPSLPAVLVPKRCSLHRASFLACGVELWVGGLVYFLAG